MKKIKKMRFQNKTKQNKKTGLQVLTSRSRSRIMMGWATWQERDMRSSWCAWMNPGCAATPVSATSPAVRCTATPLFLHVYGPRGSRNFASPSVIYFIFLWRKFCVYPKWRLSTGRFSQFWLQVKYHSENFKYLSIFLATYLNHV